MREEGEEVKREGSKEEPSVSAFENWVAGLGGQKLELCSRTQKKPRGLGLGAGRTKVDD